MDVIQRAGRMSLKLKIILLTLFPLVLISVAIGWITIDQTKTLGQKEVETFRNSLLAAKEQALKDHLSIALGSIEHIYNQASEDDPVAQEQVKAILRQLEFGDDGYFFVYDETGTNLVHPTLPDLQGQNLINLMDSNGNFLIQKLLNAAQAGGGFHQYLWHKPSTDEVVSKLSYASWLPKWSWMLGTGLYIEDIDQRVAEVENSIQKNIDTTLLTIGVLLSVAVFVMIAIALAVNLHEHRLADDRIRELAHKTVMMQEDEKKHLARELHDGVNQLLISAKCHMELLGSNMRKGDRDRASDHLTKGENSLMMAISEIRAISHNLRPSALDDIGLVAALSSLIEDFSASTTIRVNRTLGDINTPLPTEVVTTLYRVVQESLVNIEKHSASNQVELELAQLADRLQLIIRDNGKGFRVGEALKGKGIGLRNMRERVEFIGGDLEISSDIGHGTEIVVLLDLKRFFRETH